MTISAATLRAMHRIHRQLTDLRERRDRGPKLIQAAEGSAKKADDEVARLKELQKQTRLAASQKELQLKERESRIKDLQRKLNESQSNREFSALKEQIAADIQANSVLSDEIIELLEKIENLQLQVGEAEKVAGKAKEEVAKAKKRVDDERSGIEADIARLTVDLAKVEEALPPDFKKDFDRLAKARGENAMAQVEGEVCGGCFSTMTPQMLNELSQSKPVFCKSCGRLLYLPE